MKRSGNPKMSAVAMWIAMVVLAYAGGLAQADFSFGEPTNLGPSINSPASDFTACISPDGLSFFFASNRAPGGDQDFDLWVVTRPMEDADWGIPEHLGDVVNSRQNEWAPFLSPDGLELYYAKGPWGDTDIVVSRRESLSAPWGPPENLGPTINSGTWDGSPCISADGLELYLYSSRTGSPDLYVASRATASDPWGPATNLGPIVNSTYGNQVYGDQGPILSADGLTLFFTSARPPGSRGGDMMIWMTRRATREAAWQAPVPLGPPLNGTSSDWTASLSPDGQVFYFISDRPGGCGGDSDFWQAPIITIVDFNGDGNVDGKDVAVMADHWGQSDPRCDIGPYAWGDGLVDVEDLKVLAGYIGTEVEDPTLVAHWTFDEAEGDTAHDSVGRHDALLMGDPIWRPDAGKVRSALEFDGLDDVAAAGFVLDPGDGPFSAFVWVNTSVAGGVFLSQESRSNWLRTDSTTGSLVTELLHGGRGPQQLVSQAIVTDSQWHRVGLVWDGANRILYVDDVEVASDAPGAVPDCPDGLYLGAGMNLEPATFWTGLIDDVRIYDRAVRP